MIPIATLLVCAALQAAASATAMTTAVERIAASASNEARFDAVTALLASRDIPFTVERFTIEHAMGREPRTEGRNIVVSFGTNGRASGSPAPSTIGSAALSGPRIEYVLIGAHYDAVRLPDGTLSHGAVDNAGSSAVLLQLAGALKAQPPAGRAVTLVWFDMEELGLVGSAKYVEAHGADRIAAMVNLDINAYGDTIIFGSSRSRENAAVRRAVLETCAAKDASCVGMPQMPPGDDRSFAKAGIPAVSMAMVSAVEAHQLWLAVNAGAASGLAPGTTPAVLKTIHTPNDTIDKVNGEAMTRVADFTLHLVRSLTALP